MSKCNYADASRFFHTKKKKKIFFVNYFLWVHVCHSTLNSASGYLSHLLNAQFKLYKIHGNTKKIDTVNGHH